ncbi:TraM recognition domain-containing protein [Streptomyces sp. RB6PN25]|uniref:TraM recognition domain-containing protein n=1 Tax=Streptomyces humicola TaxID=2953240 RepID=A0ABT1Q3S4_9ACTN|nr:type IV secretory system conjugative DNA transfer family protein [Streptomyces humicola]MCQ4084573.1 TraM recognition domain-containing protein [Streptomyces humicola]
MDPRSGQGGPSWSPRRGGWWSRGEGGIPDGLLVALICFLLGITVLSWTATGLAGLLANGHWPHDLHFTNTPEAMRQLLSNPKDMSAAWQGVPATDLPRPGLFWGVLLGQLMVLIVLGVFAIGTLTRLRAVRAAARQPGNGRTRSAARTEPSPQAHPPVAEGRPAAPQPAPGLPEAPQVPQAPQTVALPEPRTQSQLTGSHVLFAGPRSDKGKRIIQPAVLDSEGPVVVTCADATTWEQTVGNRSKLGPVHIFDPEHLLDTPDRLRWAPHSGCDAPEVAAGRARALLAPLRTHDVTTNDAAATLLRCWLHAAAVDGLPFRQLHRWAAGTGIGDAVRVLRTARDAASGWSGELEATLHAHPERRDDAQELIQKALSGLNSIHIRDACNPGRSDALDLESFINDRGTLYVVGTSREDPRTDPGAMPLLTALVSSVVEHGRRMAAGSSPGRLDPPLTCVLDDVASIAPIPELPVLMADGPGMGIPVLAVLRSEEQARHRWPAREAQNIWQAAKTRLTVDD